MNKNYSASFLYIIDQRPWGLDPRVPVDIAGGYQCSLGDLSLLQKERMLERGNLPAYILNILMDTLALGIFFKSFCTHDMLAKWHYML